MMWPMVRLFYRLAMPRFALALGAVTFAVGWVVLQGPWAVTDALGGAPRFKLPLISSALIVCMPLVELAAQARPWPLLLPVPRRTVYAAMHVGVLAAVLPGVVLAAYWFGSGSPLCVGDAANLGMYLVVGSVLAVFVILALLPGLWTWHWLGFTIAIWAVLVAVGLAALGHVFALALAAPIYWLGRRWFVQFDACGPNPVALTGAAPEWTWKARGALWCRLPGATRLLAGVVWLRSEYGLALFFAFGIGMMLRVLPESCLPLAWGCAVWMENLRSQLDRLRPLRREVVYHMACTPVIVMLLAGVVLGIAFHQDSAWSKRVGYLGAVHSYVSPAERDRMLRWSSEEEQDIREAWWQKRASLVAQSVANEHANRYGLMWDAEKLLRVDRFENLVVTTEHLRAEVLAAWRWRGVHLALAAVVLGLAALRLKMGGKWLHQHWRLAQAGKRFAAALCLVAVGSALLRREWLSTGVMDGVVMTQRLPHAEFLAWLQEYRVAVALVLAVAAGLLHWRNARAMRFAECAPRALG